MALFAVVSFCIGDGLRNQNAAFPVIIADSLSLEICSFGNFIDSVFDRPAQRLQLGSSSHLTLQQPAVESAAVQLGDAVLKFAQVACSDLSQSLSFPA